MEKPWRAFFLFLCSIGFLLSSVYAETAGLPHEEEHLLVPLTGLLTAFCVVLTVVFAKMRNRFQGWLRFHRLFAGMAVALMVTHFLLVVLGK